MRLLLLKRVSYIIFLFPVFCTCSKDDDKKFTPQILSVNSSTCRLEGNVTISGKNFDRVTKVQFSGKDAHIFTIVSPAQIIAIVSSTTPLGPGLIQVATDQGQSNTKPVTILPPLPGIFTVSPASGIKGDTVRITGSNFTTNSRVLFGSLPAPVIESSRTGTSLQVIVPEGAKSGSIILEADGESVTSAQDFKVIGAPANVSLSPAKGLAGSTVTIQGNDLAGASVKFAQTEATVERNTASEVIVKVPQLPVSGVVNVQIRTRAGITDNIPFTVTLPQPRIERLLPFVLYADDSFIISGLHFGTNPGIKLNGLAIEADTRSETIITAKVPGSMTPGEILVTVTTESGESDAYRITMNPGSPPPGPVNPPNMIIPVNPAPGYLGSITNGWNNNYDPDHSLVLNDPQLPEVGEFFGTEFHTSLEEYNDNPLTGKVDKINNTIEFTITRDTPEKVYEETYKGWIDSTDGVILIIVFSTTTGRQLVF